MRKLLLIFTLAATPWARSFAGQIQFTNVVKATLMFREESVPSAHYPHLLHVYLCLENKYDSDVIWVCDSVDDVEAELLDAKGNPVPQPAGAMSIQSNPSSYRLPYGSRLDWMVSLNGGISMFHDPKKTDGKEECALIVGARGWLIPRDSLASYPLKLRVKGWPEERREEVAHRGGATVLFEVPPTAILIK
jgi:hypothetical protein